MAEILSKRCNGNHKHQPLVSGRCYEAAFYPLKLVQAIIRGIRATADAEYQARIQEREGKEVIFALKRSELKEHLRAVKEDPALSNGIPNDVPGSKVTRAKGGKIPIAYDPSNFRKQYLDEYTGEVLEPKLIAAAIVDELDYFNRIVWEIEDKATMAQVPDHIFVRSRWVTSNKSDKANPDCRARLVCCEINRGDKKTMRFTRQRLHWRQSAFSLKGFHRSAGGIGSRFASLSLTSKRLTSMEHLRELYIWRSRRS